MILMPGSAAAPRLASTPYVPGAIVTMFDEPLPPDQEGGDWYNYSIRQLVTPLANSGRQFRFTFYKSGGTKINHASFEMQESDYKTAQQPKEILFAGASGFAHGPTGDGAAAHGTVVSDWMELWHAIGPLNKMIVILDCGLPAGGSGYFSVGMGDPLRADLKAWYRSSPSYNLAVPTGTWNVNNFWLGPIKKIEVR